MMFEELSTLPIKTDTDPYRWGRREAKALRYGYNIASYPVPVNSWSDNDSTLEYIKGLHNGLDFEWSQTHLGPDNDSAIDASF